MLKMCKKCNNLCFAVMEFQKQSVIELVVLATFHNWAIPTKNKRIPKLHVFV